MRAVWHSEHGELLQKRFAALMKEKEHVDSAASLAVGYGWQALLAADQSTTVQNANEAARLVRGYMESTLAADGTSGNRWSTTDKRILRSHTVAQVASFMTSAMISGLAHFVRKLRNN